MRRIRFVVVGRVQGVAFRAYAQAEARRLGVMGFVQNRPDGAVEGEAEGRPDDVVAFLAWLRTGSPWSRVDNVEIDEMSVVGNDGTFDVHR